MSQVAIGQTVKNGRPETPAATASGTWPSRRSRRALLALAGVLALAGLEGLAHAQPAEHIGASEPPWARGVSEADRREAQRLFQEGTALLQQRLFAQAVEKYQQAPARWDLPAIHYNLAIAQFNLAHDIEAYHSVERALRHGEAALDADKYRDAQALKQQLEKRLAHLTVTCTQPGARVSLDGAPLFTGSGTRHVRVAPGGHQIIAASPGYYTETVPVVLAPGEARELAIELRSAAPVTVRRWTWWKPWAVAGAGAGAMLLGGVAHGLSTKAFSGIDDELRTSGCEAGVPSGDPPHTGGCTEVEADLRGRLSTARRQKHIAFGVYAVGGVAVATGLVLAYFNRARLVSGERALGLSAMIEPAVAADMIGAQVRVGF